MCQPPVRCQHHPHYRRPPASQPPPGKSTPPKLQTSAQWQCNVADYIIKNPKSTLYALLKLNIHNFLSATQLPPLQRLRHPHFQRRQVFPHRQRQVSPHRLQGTPQRNHPSRYVSVTWYFFCLKKFKFNSILIRWCALLSSVSTSTSVSTSSSLSTSSSISTSSR